MGMQQEKPTKFKIGDRVIYPEYDMKGTVVGLAVYDAVKVEWDDGKSMLVYSRKLNKIES
jgi:hypothetical protein